MPEALHQKLHEEAIAKGYREGSDRYNAYVYGTLAKVEKRQGLKRGKK